ncbi:putative F420-dependent oxidoreductase [Gordonia araii NBRC 100433]|uniref:Putative F420-dependent oxidoreductase n=1 Tax=Gordonia araii NBRC 100433 TaxID=1073574 RepID=G7GXX0_9ACTN|nr:TIGR03564 family F420-dependent LLM class oxidoreductase [Gordonia araii]GAB08445.1 putative F420-dependent oxidoreductase [Gordonia araii NBRC 100433]
MEITIMHAVDGRKTLHLDEYLATLVTLESEGFRRIWATQMPNDGDALTVLAVAGREVPRIEFATGVLPIQTQHAMKLAQQALTVNAITGGRLTLGIGLTHKVVSEGMWGIPYERPLRRMSEYLDGLLPLLAGEMADAAGELTTTRGVMTLSEVPAPPVYLAALGPQMLALAGRRTGGTVTWMTGPKTLRDHIVPSLRAAAEEAGRSASDVRTVSFLPVAVTDDVETSRETAARQFRMYDSLPSYRTMLDREGYAGPADAAIIGDEKTVAARLRELADAGVDEYVGIVFDRDEQVRARTRALLRELDGA